MTNLKTTDIDEDEIAGLPLDEPTIGMTAVTASVESLDGAPLVQYDGDPLDVDGSPLAPARNDDDEDIEGVPLDIGFVRL